ncbi:MAG: hypothetical protein V1886_00695 [archaeon]
MKENENSKDESVIIKINPQIYSMQVIYAAAYSMLDRAYIILDGNPKKEIIVQIFRKNGKDAEKIKQEFYDELINYGNYYASLKREKDIVKMILERALFSANPSIAEEAEEKEIEELLRDLDETKSKK